MTWRVPNLNVSMRHEKARDDTYGILHSIYAKHRRCHKENPDSKQLCCMWSTDDPPDIIEGTEPICDIEAAFGIEIDDDEALKLYDMNLDEAARKIREMKRKKSQPSDSPAW